jgi:uncharacterized PurR-regulated membrane protein YhhQ (DUF165 family)
MNETSGVLRPVVLRVALAVLSNWLASRFTITVPLTTLVAPAGVLTIGACFVLRDWLAQLAGFGWGLAVIPVAGAASSLIGEAAGWTGLRKIAVASVLAFLASETLEAAVFAPLRRRSLTGGVLASGLVGNALDSWLFLTLAFGSLAFFWGNFVGKAEMILVGAALTATRRRLAPVRSEP